MMFCNGAFADFSSSIVSKLSVAFVRQELSIRAYLQPLHGPCNTRMGIFQRNVDGTQKNFQMSPLGWIWMGSSTKK